ncbi:MAG: hypothetical protein EOP47_29520, partial [Sphingobacteriaceae bacterium]
MKYQLKFLFSALTVSIIFNHVVKAQTNVGYKHADDRVFKISIGTSLGITTKNSPFNYGLGLDIQAQYYLSEQLAITASGGYSRLLTKDTSPQSDYDFIPILMGAKVFPVNRIYLNGNIGLGIPIQNRSTTSLVFGGGFGYEFDRNFDLSVKYIGYQQSKSSSTRHRPNRFLVTLPLHDAHVAPARRREEAERLVVQ